MFLVHLLDLIVLEHLDIPEILEYQIVQHFLEILVDHLDQFLLEVLEYMQVHLDLYLLLCRVFLALHLDPLTPMIQIIHQFLVVLVEIVQYFLENLEDLNL